MYTVAHSTRDVLLTVTLYGTFAVGYAACGVTRRYIGFAILGVLEFYLEYWRHRIAGAPASLIGLAHPSDAVNAPVSIPLATSRSLAQSTITGQAILRPAARSAAS
jgi:hypothetical protein